MQNLSSLGEEKSGRSALLPLEKRLKLGRIPLGISVVVADSVNQRASSSSVLQKIPWKGRDVLVEVEQKELC